MPKRLVISLVLLFVLVGLWVLIFLLSGNNYCPDKLPDSYYECSTYEDCYFHPKYECINVNQLNCLINEDLSIKQEVASHLACECINGVCEAVVIPS